jgi:lauroyl/myristoyl acyltransferase
MPDEMSKVVLALVSDLMFRSKIAAEAKAQNIQIEFVRDACQLAQKQGSKLIVDLNHQGAIELAAAWKQSTGKPVIAFVSHVDTETIDQARRSGLDQILARSRFTQQLGSILAN